MQLISNIYRANTYSRTNLVFAKAYSTRFYYISRLIIYSAYTNNIQRQVGIPGFYRKYYIYLIFYRCPVYTNHIQRGHTPPLPSKEDDTPPSPSYYKYNQSIYKAYTKYILGPKKHTAPKAKAPKAKALKAKAKKANILSITLVYTKLILSSYYRQSIFKAYY